MNDCWLLSSDRMWGRVLAVLYLAVDHDLFPLLHNRTLLALGCHIAHVNPAAEEDLKKVKLSKKWVIFSIVQNFKCLSLNV